VEAYSTTTVLKVNLKTLLNKVAVAVEALIPGKKALYICQKSLALVS
jgi:hypothetical protein